MRPAQPRCIPPARRAGIRAFLATGARHGQGAPFLALTHLKALWVVVAPAIVQALPPLIVFWYLLRPDVEAFFAR